MTLSAGITPVSPESQPPLTHSIKQARRLLEHLAASYPGLLRGSQTEALRQVLVQNYRWDPAGRLCWRDDDGDAGLPPSAARVVSPYDPAARYSRRGQVTRWAATSPT